MKPTIPHGAPFRLSMKMGAWPRSRHSKSANDPTFSEMRWLCSSCESGASGRLDAGPAGLAGALLSVGAQVVIAPLWPVLLRTAIRVGRAAIKHMAGGGPIAMLSETLRCTRSGRDANPSADEFFSLPYVVWCG